jgi:hypothetical protein
MTRHKRMLTPHEKQMRFITCFLGTMIVLTVVGLIWFINSLSLTGHAH